MSDFRRITEEPARAEPTPVAEDSPQGLASGVSSGQGVRGAGQSKRSSRAVIEWIAVLIVALVGATVLRLFVVEAYLIPSTSMVPTLQVGDRILVNKLSYDLGSVHRGNIVVFRRPPGNTIAPNITDLVKRVVGLPGQRIASGPNGTVLINGRAISQPWLPPHTAPGPAIRPQVIPKGMYFMMGDNRSNSEDSRFFGPISGKLIVGKVVARIWPLRRFHLFG